MNKTIIFLLFIIFSTTVTHAQEIVFPAIQGYGGVIPVSFEAEKPDPSKKYKFIIEIGEKIKDKTDVAGKLDYAARMYNLHRYAGVPKENIELAIVIYAGSTPIILTDSTYSKKFDQLNPNLALLNELQRNDIQVIVCGQSMMKQDLLPQDIYPGVRKAVSRFTATTNLIEHGYQVFVL